MLNQGRSQADRPQQVRRDCGCQELLVDFSRGVVDQHDPGIVDQHIERRIVRDQLFRNRGDIRGIQNIEFDGIHPRIRLGRCIQMFLATVGDDDLVAEFV